MTQEPVLPFVGALRAFSSIPCSPRKAYTVIVTHRTLTHALILVLASAFLSAIAEFFLVGRVIESMTILYLIEVPYSDIAWITNEFFIELARFAVMTLVAFLVVEGVSGSRKPFRRYLSAMGYFIPWSLLVSWTIFAVWQILSDATSASSFDFIYWVLYPPMLIWLLWLVGNAISAAGEVPVSVGVLAGLAAAFFSFVVPIL